MAGGTMSSSATFKGNEHSPLLVTSKTVSMYEAATADGQADGRPVLVRKYAVEAKHVHSYQKMDGARLVTSTYGTLALNHVEDMESIDGAKKKSLSPRREVGPENDPEATHAGNNQSETESDSDGSCGSSATQPPGIQSILRIRTGDLAGRTLQKKPSSVGFAIDICDTDDEDDEYQGDAKSAKQQKRTSRRSSCAARCIPRRLTLEEKAELYRVRPDLELTPMPVLLRDLEEMRRRRQRKLVFTVLGGTLILLMMVVMYYVFSQV